MAIPRLWGLTCHQDHRQSFIPAFKVMILLDWRLASTVFKLYLHYWDYITMCCYVIDSVYKQEHHMHCDLYIDFTCNLQLSRSSKYFFCLYLYKI